MRPEPYPELLSDLNNLGVDAAKFRTAPIAALIATTAVAAIVRRLGIPGTAPNGGFGFDARHLGTAPGAIVVAATAIAAIF